MPVHRYRDVSEMEDRSWRAPGDPALFRAIRATWDFARRTTQPRFPPGVYKHRSVAEAEKLRDAWERATLAMLDLTFSGEASRIRGRESEPSFSTD